MKAKEISKTISVFKALMALAVFVSEDNEKFEVVQQLEKFEHEALGKADSFAEYAKILQNKAYNYSKQLFEENNKKYKTMEMAFQIILPMLED